MEKDIFLNYKKSLEQKYNAVCFGIDGTLTEKNSIEIDKRVIPVLIDLLKRKIPIVFITGRGKTGLSDLKKDIYEPLISSKELTDEDMKRIYVLTNDGARMFYSEKISDNDFLKENIYISTKEELEQLKYANNLMINTQKYLNMEDLFEITYSYGSDNKKQISDEKTILNIRLNFKTNDDKIINDIFDTIDKMFMSVPILKSITLTRGSYKNRPVIQIGTAKKDKAIERAEEKIGVPKDSMIRIGDCGDRRGNDYAMLRCSQGYSVDKTSGDKDACFPIFDESGKILTGIEATLYLIKNAKILPTVCLEKANKKDYISNFSKVEQQIVMGSKKTLQKFNNHINENFNDINGMNSIFHERSGSVRIPMYEWLLLKNNPLRDFWETSDNNNLTYALRDDNEFILRGAKTYYYFLANRKSDHGHDSTSKQDVINWYCNYINFFADAQKALEKTDDINDIINKKFALGILDNCRNVLLLLINHNLVSNYGTSNVLLDISSYDKGLIDEYKSMLTIERMMSKICFEHGLLISKEEIQRCINITKNILEKNYVIELRSNVKDDYSKDYRAYREIDNFAENYVAVSLYNENKKPSRNGINSCGLSYGGIELPFISKIINEDQVERLLLLKLNKTVFGYAKKQLMELRKFDIKKEGSLVGAEELVNSSVSLFDDNILTGKTLQITTNSLYDYNINVDDICIVRYPGANRIDQMFFDNPTAVDHRLFFNYIYGLCFPSPYSWKDSEWKRADGSIDYEDSLGVFDRNRKKIIECLLKNHDYREDSEVGEYKRRLLYEKGNA